MRRTATLLVLVAGWAAHAGEIRQVSQRDRTFAPKQIEVTRGDMLRIVNDDGELVHHAYADGDGLKFDSGEQAPGSHLDIPLTRAGSFTVLCAIHPKMRLAVTVR